MTHVKNKIYIKNYNHFLENQLATFLQARGFTVIDSFDVKHADSVPWVIFQSDLSIEDQMVVHTESPKMIFNIQSTDRQQTQYPSIETVVNIQLENTAQQKKPVHPSHTETLIQSIGQIIAKYVDNPPGKGVYTEKVTFKNTQAETVGVVGLGYVGLPIAVAFTEKYNVIGFDINEQKVQSLANNNDPAGEISTVELKDASIHFTSEGRELEHCDYIIVAVPTPITQSKKPDLSHVVAASTMISKHLSPETVVIYESTVYPGTTEDVCIPLLETHSLLTAGIDFYVGYSPERMNPGDEKRTFKQNDKVVSGQNEKALEKIVHLYESVLDAYVHKAPSMAVAETSKIVENAQRDINIAFMNELAIICNVLELDTNDVLQAAQTKWNFLPFTPGLVGGHCIGIDPYYLMYKSQIAGYDPLFLSAARQINDSIPQYIVQQLLQLLTKHAYTMKNLQITVLGVTFKENISDIRNSKALEIVQLLEELNLDVQLCDPHADEKELHKITDAPLISYDRLEKSDVVIIAVPHDAFSLPTESFFEHLFKDNKGIIADIKGIIPSDEIPDSLIYWTF